MAPPVRTVKVFISQLWELSRNDEKRTFLKGFDISNTLVWTQGIITECNPTTWTLIIDDGTGLISVGSAELQSGCEMPGGSKHVFQKGQYVLVVGAVFCTKPELDRNTTHAGGGGGGGSGSGSGSGNVGGLHRFGHVALEAVEASGVLYLGEDPNMETLWLTEVIQAQQCWTEASA